ncbi:MAG: signal peptidase II [bacterium]|nr:signal peptidase II [bacterium]
MFFIGDRWLKLAAISLDPGQSTTLIGDWLQFRLVMNPGIAFSLPLRGDWLTILLSLIIAALFFVIIYLTLKKKANYWTPLLLTVILFGAISNILDRYIYGAVIDYLDLKYFSIFNIADAMISSGVIILVWRKWRR